MRNAEKDREDILSARELFNNQTIAEEWIHWLERAVSAEKERDEWEQAARRWQDDEQRWKERAVSAEQRVADLEGILGWTLATLISQIEGVPVRNMDEVISAASAALKGANE